MQVPSPKKEAQTWSADSSPRTSLLYLAWKAAPAPTGMPSPMKAKPPRKLCSAENMCMLPPWPLQMPSFFPKSSAMTLPMGTPLDTEWTWSL